jgi:hypothetical protein
MHDKMTESKILRGIVVALIVVWVVVTLSGCSGGEGTGPDGRSCNATFGYEYDQVSSTGLTLRATGHEYSYITFEEMEAEYIDLEACVANTNTPGPIVEFTSFDDYGFPLDLALYYYALQTVFIDTDYNDRPQRNCISDRKFLRHEFTHHVLYLNGEEPGHENLKFAQCKALGPKTCNGAYCED